MFCTKVILWLLTLILVFYPSNTRAEAGAQQQYLSGLALEYNPETIPDYSAIGRHYQAAATGGSREARLALARLSEPGGPLDQGPQVWRERLMAATEAGWPEAAYRLGEALEQGLLPADPRLNPASLYLQAAMAGHGPAAWRLGESYYKSQAGSGPDEGRAVIWLSLAATNGVEEAALSLGRLYYKKNPQVAMTWLERTTSAEGAYLAGQLYLESGRAIEAIASLASAADRGHASAHLALGLIYTDNDFGVRTNPRVALRHFKIAGQAGLAEGCYQLAQMYLWGRATPKDPITGAFWLHQAASGGHETAGGELDKLKINFSIGRLKRLERMIEEGVAPTTQTRVE